MNGVYKLARTWRNILIISSAGLVFLFLIPIFSGNISGQVSDFVWAALAVGGISGLLSYASIQSKIITSQTGIEYVSFGARVKANWDRADRVEINPFGFVNLVFKESLHKNRLINFFLKPLGYDRLIQLSPYIDDFATSHLLRDIEVYAPDCYIPKFVIKRKRSSKAYQKPGNIGIYYLVWGIGTVVLALAFRKGAELLESIGYPNMTLVSYFSITSLMIGLFLNGMRLLGYNAEISDLSENRVVHKARSYYVLPIFILFSSLVVGLGIWVFLRLRAITLPGDDYRMFGLVAILLGILFIGVNEKVERLFFRE